MKRFSCVTVALLLLTFMLPLVSSVTAQTPGKTGYDFAIILKLRSKVWDTRLPLKVDVIFKNRGRTSFYIANKCEFGFEGHLDKERGEEEPLHYYINWDHPSASCTLRRDDFIEVRARKSVRVTLTSVGVEDSESLPWPAHPRGRYTFFVRYATSKVAPFNGVWLGSTGSARVQIYVK